MDRPVITVANRLPVERTASGWKLSPGGLVTALQPVMASRAGVWVGWDGGSSGIPANADDLPTGLEAVSLPGALARDYYQGFANRSLWPLLHNAIEHPRFERSWWAAYQSANHRFAESTGAVARERQGALAWVHDYHLMLVPQLLRAAHPRTPIGFFLHVPWPAPDIFARLPWRRQVLEGVLGADVVSFHTESYRRNFMRTCERLATELGVSVHGSLVQLADERVVRTTADPISIDVAEFRAHAVAAETASQLQVLRDQFAGRRVLLGVDRLDYTKGLLERLLAVEMLLERRTDLRGELVFVQIAVPSRGEVTEYRQLRQQVERAVGRINGRFTLPGHDVPIHYLYRGVGRRQLAAYYALADLLLVTPLIDGMNLVAKEFVVVQSARQGSGALILSEFTGAAAELRESMACNPFDVEGLSVRIERALELTLDERVGALRAMSRRIARHDVHSWLARQLTALAGDEPI